MNPTLRLFILFSCYFYATLIYAEFKSLPHIQSQYQLDGTTKCKHPLVNQNIKGNTAILLIDMNRLYAEPTEETEGVANQTAEIKNMVNVLETANNKNFLVYEINFFDNTLPVFKNLRANNWRFLDKGGISAFQNTCLHQDLKMHNITKLIVMGFNQTACVRNTVNDAYNLNYEIYTSFEVMHSKISPTNFKNWVSKGRPYEEQYGLQAAANGYEEEDSFENTLLFYKTYTKLLSYLNFPIFD